MIEAIHFANKYCFLLLALIPLLVFWYWKKQRTDRSSFNFSGFDKSWKNKPSLKIRLLHLPFILRLIGLIFLIIVLARPQSNRSRQDVSVEGIDIVMALDISGSMLAEDFRPNRLEAAKEVAMEFIDGRPDDRIGLVVFSGESFTQCPITTDHVVLKNLFSGIKSGMIDDGTALGEGLATAVSRLRSSTAKSKVIILLTDGVNNMGVIAPLTAAEIAHTYGIRVYTIGIGRDGMAPYPFQTVFGVQYQNIEVKIDEALLSQIAKMNGTKYFRATNKNKLKDIYAEIDKMEKTKIDVTEYHRKNEEYLPFLLFGLLMIISGELLRLTYLKKTP